MIIVFKENNRFYFATLTSVNSVRLISNKTLMDKENQMIRKIKDGKLLIGGMNNLPTEYILNNEDLILPELDDKSILIDTINIKDELKDKLMLFNNNEMQSSIVIANNEHCYVITDTFISYEVTRTHAVTDCDNNFDFVEGIIDSFTGSEYDRVVKALRLLAKEELIKGAKIIIKNTMDDNVDIIDAM